MKPRFHSTTFRHAVLHALAAAGLLLAGHSGAQATAAAADAEVFARVGSQVITLREYQAALTNGVRQKFYHGRPPEGELAKFSREVGEKLITQALLAAEADRRGIAPDREAIAAQIAEYDRRYAENAQWQLSRASILPRLTGELERRSRLERLEAAVRDVPLPDDDAARAYHAANPAMFTEPERFRISLIIVRVDPAALAADVEAARLKAEGLRAELAKGADFAGLAREHSADASAQSGGDLGYVHRGMLPEAVEARVLEGIAPGTILEPMRVLEGFAIVRLDERQPPRSRRFEDVASSARELLRRERAEQAWTTLIADLRATTAVQVDESRFLPVGAN